MHIRTSSRSVSRVLAVVCEGALHYLSQTSLFQTYNRQQLKKMSISTTELIKAVAVIVDRADLKVCAQQSAQGALMAGAASLVGGVLFGPIGLALGGAIGGVTAMLSQGKSINSQSRFIANHLHSRRIQVDFRNTLEFECERQGFVCDAYSNSC